MKVLLVDDSKAARFAMRNLLEKQGAEVTMAGSGEEALEMIADNPVDIVFMDQSMPGMGGIEATRKITSDETTAHIPVVLCTGNEGDKLEQMAEEAGAIGVLTKPPKAKKLEAVFASLKTAAPAEAEQPASEVTEEEEEDMGKLMAAMEDLQQQISQFDGLKDSISSGMEDKIAAILKASEENLQPLQKAVGDIGDQIRQQVKDHIAMDSGNQRIQLETLRQQVESGLEDIQEREVEFQSGLKEEITKATTTTVTELVNSQVSTLKDSNDQLKAELQSRLDKMEKTVSRLKSGLLVKATSIAAVTAGIAFIAAYFLLK